MTQVLSVISGKGGVGKTLLTAALGIQLSRMGKKVLLIDGDHFQCKAVQKSALFFCHLKIHLYVTSFLYKQISVIFIEYNRRYFILQYTNT